MSDLHIGPELATPPERAAVDSVVPASRQATIYEDERLVRGGAKRRDELRTELLPVLHALQRRVGYISPGALNLIAERLGVPPAESYGVATFYSLLKTEDPGVVDDIVHVCVDSPCRAAAEELSSRLNADGLHVEPSPCLGQCERAPAQFTQRVDAPDRVEADALEAAAPVFGEPGARRRARRIGVVDPTSHRS
jgi:NADH-quinone oxidoreductase subunit F